MSIAPLLAPAIVAGLLIYMASQVDEEEHMLLRMLLILSSVAFLLLVGKGAIEAQQSCQSMLNTTVGLSNVTHVTETYTYTDVCLTSVSSSSSTLFKAVTWMARLIGIYMFLYLSWYVLQWFSRSISGGEKR